MDIKAEDFLIVITIFQLFVFSILLFTINKGNRISNFFPGLFFLTLSINIFNSFVFRFSDFFISHCIHIFYLGSSFALLYPPLFYLYIQSFESKENSINKYLIWHLTPFILLSIYIVLSFSILPPIEKREILLSG